MDTTVSLKHQISSATSLQSVVRTMKAVAASSMGDYERAVAALGDYYGAVERGLGACFSVPGLHPGDVDSLTPPSPACIVVFGTDQGLVGQFNDAIADFALSSPAIINSAQSGRAPLPQQTLIWAIGSRLNEQLNDAGITTQAHFEVPSSVKSITPLIGNILLNIENQHPLTAVSELHLFYHRPAAGSAYRPVTQALLPLDLHWCTQLARQTWPTNNLPELLGDQRATLGALIREYLFVSLFRACAESLASENASRLAAMQRAEENIDDLLAYLEQSYHRLRQARIDEEMFDVIAGSNQ